MSSGLSMPILLWSLMVPLYRTDNVVTQANNNSVERAINELFDDPETAAKKVRTKQHRICRARELIRPLHIV